MLPSIDRVLDLTDDKPPPAVADGRVVLAVDPSDDVALGHPPRHEVAPVVGVLLLQPTVAGLLVMDGTASYLESPVLLPPLLVVVAVHAVAVHHAAAARVVLVVLVVVVAVHGLAAHSGEDLVVGAFI